MEDMKVFTHFLLGEQEKNLKKSSVDLRDNTSPMLSRKDSLESHHKKSNTVSHRSLRHEAATEIKV
jgi:hypothetical protein